MADGENWESVASHYGIGVKDLIYANFKTLIPEEVNWYLHHYVKCDTPTHDRYNWRFSTSARSGGGPRAGIIFIPPKSIVFDDDHVIGTLPKVSESSETTDFSIRTFTGIPVMKAGVGVEWIAFEIRNNKNGDVARYQYLGPAAGLGVTATNTGPWNDFRTNKPILETDFAGLAEFHNVQATKHWSRSSLLLLVNTPGVLPVNVNPFKTAGIGLGASDSRGPFRFSKSIRLKSARGKWSQKLRRLVF